ncbi:MULTISPECIES: HutD/Ves family protein [Pseudomonas]|jgi:environmental stress-induced protein Ves|uniref:HutD family protein n=1 Tax=Pseudomonas kulmbachensis TaxID=3043408 RepID=A0ABW7LVY0_9PSED|nr:MULTISPECIES: HutD family protein [Pseudomonas]UXL38352.1 HutD family protein [Pseudomonas fragi]
MSQTVVLRAADYPRMPWKNGGGSTEEITRDAGEGLEGFGWRLSIADIGESGGFSRFDGYQRVISVLQGAGMNLKVDGVSTRGLLPFDAFAFRGESAVTCTLIDGPIRDFNLIYAPHRYAARLQWLHATTPQRLFSSAHTLLVFGAGEQTHVSLGNTSHEHLGRYDCLQLSGNRQLLEITVTGLCCVIELTPV